jgi:hypothetical protein
VLSGPPGSSQGGPSAHVPASAVKVSLRVLGRRGWRFLNRGINTTDPGLLAPDGSIGRARPEGPRSSPARSYFCRGTIRCSRHGPIRVVRRVFSHVGQARQPTRGHVADVNDDPLEWGHRIVKDTPAGVCGKGRCLVMRRESDGRDPGTMFAGAASRQSRAGAGWASPAAPPTLRWTAVRAEAARASWPPTLAFAPSSSRSRAWPPGSTTPTWSTFTLDIQAGFLRQNGAASPPVFGPRNWPPEAGNGEVATGRAPSRAPAGVPTTPMRPSRCRRTSTRAGRRRSSARPWP